MLGRNVCLQFEVQIPAGSHRSTVMHTLVAVVCDCNCSLCIEGVVGLSHQQEVMRAVRYRKCQPQPLDARTVLRSGRCVYCKNSASYSLECAICIKDQLVENVTNAL